LDEIHRAIGQGEQQLDVLGVIRETIANAKYSSPENPQIATQMNRLQATTLLQLVANDRAELHGC